MTASFQTHSNPFERVANKRAQRFHAMGGHKNGHGSRYQIAIRVGQPQRIRIA